MFLLALEMLANDVLIKKLAANTCNNPKTVHRESISTDSRSLRNEVNALSKPVMINELHETTL
jgi:hypothetical protein